MTALLSFGMTDQASKRHLSAEGQTMEEPAPTTDGFFELIGKLECLSTRRR